MPIGFLFKAFTLKSENIHLGMHKNAVRLAHANNTVFKHVRDTNSAINWRTAEDSNVESHRLAVESALIRKIPNFNSV